MIGGTAKASGSGTMQKVRSRLHQCAPVQYGMSMQCACVLVQTDLDLQISPVRQVYRFSALSYKLRLFSPACERQQPFKSLSSSAVGYAPLQLSAAQSGQEVVFTDKAAYECE
eukprot:jgi/Ulvmu1/9394/UM051_0021.1